MSECSALSLSSLAARIVDFSDREALEELLARRTVFRSHSGAMVTLPAYIEDLQERLEGASGGWPTEVVEYTASLTLDKFSRMAGSGTNCAFYYRAFLRLAVTEDAGSKLKAEGRDAALLQQLVRRQFSLSFKDALRSLSNHTRFYWKEQDVHLWFSRGMSTAERQAWLKEFVGDVHRKLNAEEIHEVQVLIYDQLQAHALPRRQVQHALTKTSDDVTVVGLAEAVAREKAANIEQQRRSIRDLGPTRLRLLIRSIFDAVGSGSYDGSDIAREYGLTPSTFSRFAGKNWSVTRRKTPDLWRNTAVVLAATPKFVEAARAAGVWSQVEAVLREE